MLDGIGRMADVHFLAVDIDVTGRMRHKTEKPTRQLDLPRSHKTKYTEDFALLKLKGKIVDYAIDREILDTQGWFTYLNALLGKLLCQFAPHHHLNQPVLFGLFHGKRTDNVAIS